MCKRKKLSELTLKDNFMFGAVMANPQNCKPMLERILGIDILTVEVDREKCIAYNPEHYPLKHQLPKTFCKKSENKSRKPYTH